jgi:hypothetical protein
MDALELADAAAEAVAEPWCSASSLSSIAMPLAIATKDGQTMVRICRVSGHSSPSIVTATTRQMSLEQA